MLTSEVAPVVESRTEFRPSEAATKVKDLYFQAKLIEDPGNAKAALSTARKATEQALAENSNDVGVHVVAALIAVEYNELDSAMRHILNAPDTPIADLFLNREPAFSGDRLDRAMRELDIEIKTNKDSGDIDEAMLREFAVLTAAAKFREYRNKMAGPLERTFFPAPESGTTQQTTSSHGPTEEFATGELPTAPLAKNLYAQGAYEAARQNARKAIQENPEDQDAHEVLGLIAAGEGHFDMAMAQIRQAPDSRIAKITLGQEPDLVGDKLQQAIQALEVKKSARIITPDESKELTLLTFAAKLRTYEALENQKDIDLRLERATHEIKFRLGEERELTPRATRRIKEEGASWQDVLLEAGIDPFSKPLSYPGKPGYVTRISVRELGANDINFMPSKEYNEYRSVYDRWGQLYRLIGTEDGTFLVQRLNKKPGKALITQPAIRIPYKEFMNWKMETADYSKTRQQVTESKSESEPETNRITPSKLSWIRHLKQIIRRPFN